MLDKERNEEHERFLRNMYQLAESDCSQRRSNGFPCSKVSCEKYSTSRCLHPEVAGFPAQRY